ncbi:MAG: hypothetical protein ACKV0T_03320 [Planctomycetales bacterium]
MAKNKHQKQKDRERRVAQKKLAEAQKRAELLSAQQAETAGRRLNILAAAVQAPQAEPESNSVKTGFGRRSFG